MLQCPYAYLWKHSGEITRLDMLIAQIREIVQLRHPQHRAVRRPAAILLIGSKALDRQVQSFGSDFLR